MTRTLKNVIFLLAFLWSCTRPDTLTIKNHFGQLNICITLDGDTIFSGKIEEQIIDHWGIDLEIPYCSDSDRKIIVTTDKGEILKEKKLECPSEFVVLTFMAERNVIFDTVNKGEFTIAPPTLEVHLVNSIP